MQVFEDFEKVKVLIVGDVMLDQYWWGKVNRISPEAPVPVVSLDRKSVVAGGAANVATNIRCLGATPYLVGITGEDTESKKLRESLVDNGISTDHLLFIEERQTTVKTRVIASGQQIVRVDQEDSNSLESSIEEDVLKRIEGLLGRVDIVVISDYAKGLITQNIAEGIIESSKKQNLPVLVDPKGRDYSKYKYATVLTPNEKEALDASGVAFEGDHSVTKAGEKLIRELALSNLVVTRGKDGMTIFSAETAKINLPTEARRVYDVTGAGDTVISTLAVAMGASHDLVTACKLANTAAGIVVEKVGTSPILLEELASEYREESNISP